MAEVFVSGGSRHNLFLRTGNCLDGCPFAALSIITNVAKLSLAGKDIAADTRGGNFPFRANAQIG